MVARLNCSGIMILFKYMFFAAKQKRDQTFHATTKANSKCEQQGNGWNLHYQQNYGGGGVGGGGGGGLEESGWGVACLFHSSVIFIVF